MISRLRAKSIRLSELLAKPFVVAGISPFVVSLFAIPLALAAAFFIVKQDYLPAFFLALLAISMDFVDGAVARLSKKCSAFGNYAEGVIDKAVDFILLGCFVFLFPFAAVLAMGASFLVSFAKPRVALVIIADNRDWPGIGERADKFAILLAGLLFSSFKSSIFGFNIVETALLLVALVSFIGLFQRIFFARKLVKEAEKNGQLLPYLKKKGPEQK